MFKINNSIEKKALSHNTPVCLLPRLSAFSKFIFPQYHSASIKATSPANVANTHTVATLCTILKKKPSIRSTRLLSGRNL